MKSFLENERIQFIHRSINTLLAIMVLIVSYNLTTPLIDRVTGLEQERVVQSELSQIVMDEGYKARPYKDSRGLWTIGFGHLIKEGEDFTTLTPHDAVRLLRKDYDYATTSVEKVYPWATGDVKLVLINMTYQMGERGVSKFSDTIGNLRLGHYDHAAGDMLTSIWAEQTPLRASRLAGRIMQLTQ